MHPNLTYRLAIGALLAGMITAGPALAGPDRIEGVNKDVFRTLQYIRNNASGSWNDKQTTMFMRAVMKDGTYDDAERKLVEALQKDTFDIVVAIAKLPDFKPNDLPLKGSLPAASRTLLAKGLTPDAFTAEAARLAGPVAGETQVAFYMRSGNEGMQGLATYAMQSPQNWLEARAAILDDLRTAYARGSDYEMSIRNVRDSMGTWTSRAATISDPQKKSAGWTLAMEAALTLDVQLKGHLPRHAYMNKAHFDALTPEELKVLENLCARLGIKTSDLDPDRSKYPEPPKLVVDGK